LTAVEHDAVGSRNDFVGVRQDVVGAEREFHFHFPTRISGGIEDGCLEASAVRHRFVEPPMTIAHAPGRRGFTHHAENGKRFGDLAVAPVDAGDVAATAVAAEQNNPTGQRAFEDGQHVVAVEPEFVARELGGFDAELSAALNVFVRAGVAGDGIALSAGEVVAVADEFDGAARGVTAVEQPAEVGGGGAQGGKLPGGKEPLVLRGQPAMCLMACHGKILTFVAAGVSRLKFFSKLT